VFLADTTQEAKRQFGPVYEALTASRNVPGNNSPFRDIDHAVAEGPALVGSPEQVIDKILSYHELYGHDLQSISLPTTLPFEQQLDILERFALEVIPAVRAAAPTSLWEAGDPFGGRPESAGATEPDAAATVTADHDNYRSDHAHVYAY
jgi:alkanesulfonate monooxygenase SsuD/methylene tetrahydromethanopterin reductase-like flavin-dependent oxidoreductase (luciferase family)